MRTLRSKGLNYRFQKWNLNIIIFDVKFLVKWLKISLEPKNHRLLIPTKMKSGFTELFNHWGFLRVLTKSWVIKKIWKNTLSASPNVTKFQIDKRICAHAEKVIEWVLFNFQKFLKKVVALHYVLILHTTGVSVVWGRLTFGV